MINMETFVEGIKELELEFTEDQLNKFEKYKQLLKEWNEKINITAIKDDKEIDIKHFLDSITVLKTGYIKGNEKIIDIGTGGGFPGLPIKILYDDSQVVLLDSLNKRIKFLNEVINELELDNIRTIHGRAEDFGKDEEYREQFDVVVSRAVASLNILAEYCLPFVKVGGVFIAMKGPEINEEYEDAKKALDLLGGKLEEKFDIMLPFTDITHTLLVIKKTKTTPTKYPRNPGKPKKNPL
ncbi:16S rRNA (guanine(527)-N(7))-methyltransferase RsmG [Sporosalibacterium faouarense]|uniref:16S rRNA (guanine(527)-N(7))-methyltransferase RsmG n=1 Tax=Sporosalibacterium faouarense TaxID=516123 RepID=UPI00192A9CAD|nr:16S rRNA (guanine(527)-N(7))-methyltransferase RsmG [Sporosalibacterium faouarense]